MGHRATAAAYDRAWISDVAIEQGQVEVGYGADKQVLLLPTKNDLPILYDLTLEQAVLGAVLQAGETASSRALWDRLHVLTYKDFYRQDHGNLWRLMGKLVDEGKSPDLITIANTARTLQANKQQTLLERLGGEAYLVSLIAQASGDPASQAMLIAEMALKRTGLLTTLGVVLAQRETPNLSIDEWLERLNRAVGDVYTQAARLRNPRVSSLRQSLGSAVEAIQRGESEMFETGIPTGFPALDAVFGGWRKRKLYVFSAPPGWGKSVMLLTAALQSMLRGQRVLYVSLEMDEAEVMERTITSLSGVSADRLRNRVDLTPQESRRLANTVSLLKQLDQAADTTISILREPTPARLKGAVDDLFTRQGYDIVIIDYVGETTLAEDARPGGKPDHNELINDIFVKLKAIAEQHGIPVLTAMQMNTNYSNRRDKRPELADLRYGTAAAAKADVVAYIYDESKAKVNKKDTEPSGSVELLVRKNRSGPSNADAEIELVFNANCGRFSDLHDTMWHFTVENGKAVFSAPPPTKPPYLGDI